MIKRFALVSLVLSALAVGGCTSNIRPLRPVQQVEEWVPDSPATAPAAASASATEPAATMASATATEPATQPGHVVVKTVDPNQVVRFIYKASYDNIWQQAMALLTKTGFELDRQDYRLGVLSTRTLPSSQVMEFWKPQHGDFTNTMENTINNQRRSVRVTIQPVAEKPDFYEIGVQVLVERESNPSEKIGGPVFVEGSGFGRNAITLQSDYAAPKAEPGRWTTLGHDPIMEKGLMDALFNRI